MEGVGKDFGGVARLLIENRIMVVFYCWGEERNKNKGRVEEEYY